MMRAMPLHSTPDGRLEVRRPGRDLGTLSDANAAPGAALTAWSPLGPGNIGGRTRVLLIDPRNPEVMYAGGVSGGIWKSITAGALWEPVGDDLANIAVNSMALHPTDSNILYAGTGEGHYRESIRGTALPLRGNGIFATSDAGQTWTQLPSTATSDFHFVNDLVISNVDSRRLYAATRTGVWRSPDSGANWTRVLETDVNGGCLDLALRPGSASDTLFASCGTFDRATVWRSTNAGADTPWEAVLSHPEMGRTSLAIAPSEPSVIYALASENSPGRDTQGLLAVFRSSQNGDAGTWETRASANAGHIEKQLLSNLLTASGEECFNMPSQEVSMGWYCNTIAVDPVDANRVWAGGVDLFRSDDGGQTFGIASYWWATSGGHPSYAHADQHAIVFHPRYDGASVRTMYVTNDGGIARTDDATGLVATGQDAPCDPSHSKMQFTSLNNSYGVTQFYHGAVSPDGTTFLGGTQDNGTLLGTLDRGPNAWRGVLGGDGGYVAIDPAQPKRMFAESQWGNMARSGNGGLSFQRKTNGIQGQEFLFVAPFLLDPIHERRLWLGGRFLWTTTDSGDRWVKASTALPALVSALAIQPGNSDRVLAGLGDGRIAVHSSATTATAATEWTLVQPREGFVSSLAFDPSDPQVVYATYAGFGGSHLWVSADAGSSWTSLGDSLPDLPVHSIAVDPTRPQRLYLGTDLGVFVSLDRGATWAVENTGFANAVTETVVISGSPNGPAIYAFTHGRGVWRAALTGSGNKRRGGRR